MEIVLFVSIAVSMFVIIEMLLQKTNSKVKKIKGSKEKKRSSNIIFGSAIGVLNPLLNALFDTEKVKYKLIRSGGTLKHLGINEDNFFSFEVIYASITAAIMIFTGNSLVDIILYTCAAVALIEYLVFANTRSRKNKILTELPILLEKTIDMMEQGSDIRDLFIRLPLKLADGPLKDEVVRVKGRLSFMKLNTTIEAELNEFSKRIGLEDIDNYVLALMQHEISGRVTRILRKQYDLIKVTKNNQKKRQTVAREKMSSVASIMVVISTLLMILVPLIVAFSQSKLLNQ